MCTDSCAPILKTYGWRYDELTGGSSESDLHPASRQLAEAPFGQNARLKAAADSVVGWLLHLKFFGAGAIFGGLLFVTSHALMPSVAYETTAEGIQIDEERVTVPVIAKPLATTSQEPRRAEDLPPAPPSQTSVTPVVARPLPPTMIEVTTEEPTVGTSDAQAEEEPQPPQ
jgi:hypothetical protein